MIRSVLFLAFVALAVTVDWEAPPQDYLPALVFEDDERQLNSLISLAVDSVVNRGEWESIISFYFPAEFDPLNGPCTRSLPKNPKGLLLNILRTQKIRWCVDVNDFGENPLTDASFTAIYNHSLVYPELEGTYNEVLGVSDGDLWGPFVSLAESITIEMGVLMNAPIAPVIVFVPSSETDANDGPFDAVVSGLNKGLCDASLPQFRRNPAREQLVDFSCPAENPTPMGFYGSTRPGGFFNGLDEKGRAAAVAEALANDGANITFCDVEGTQSDFSVKLWFSEGNISSTVEVKGVVKLLETPAEAMTALCGGACDALVAGRATNDILRKVICAQISAVSSIVDANGIPLTVTPGGDLGAITARPKSRRTIVDYTHASPLTVETPHHPHAPPAHPQPTHPYGHRIGV